MLGYFFCASRFLIATLDAKCLLFLKYVNQSSIVAMHLSSIAMGVGKLLISTVVRQG